MSESVDLYGTAYGNFATEALRQVRLDTYDEQMIRDAGFELLTVEDVTENEVEVSRRWHDAREKQAVSLIQLEGEETFAGLQRFLATVHRLTSERRMSRYVYVGRKLKLAA